MEIRIFRVASVRMQSGQLMESLLSRHLFGLITGLPSRVCSLTKQPTGKVGLGKTCFFTANIAVF